MAGLRRVTTAGGDPATAITCWIASIVAVLGTFAAGVGLLLVPGDHPAGAVTGCWTALRHGRLPELDETLGAAGLAVLLIVASRFALTVARRLRSGWQAHRAFDFLRILGGRDPRPPRTLWLDHAAPLASLGSVVVAVVALPVAGWADTGATGRDLGGHVVMCAQTMGFNGQHNPGMHTGFAGWDATHMC